MSKARIAVIALGAALMLAGGTGWIIGAVTDDPAASASPAPAGTQGALSTAGATVPTTTAGTTSPPEAPAASSAATEPGAGIPTTSTVSTTSTEAALGPEAVAPFVEEFDAALSSGDTGFLFDRLHPVVVEVYSETACRELIRDEVLGMSAYALSGPVRRISQTFQVDGGEVRVDPAYAAEVSFEFGGQEFEATAVFAPLDGEIRWFTRCD